MLFSEKALEHSKAYWEGSYNHPFVLGLSSGRLEDDIFRYYLIQDMYYLEHFSNLFYMIAEKSDDVHIKEVMVANAEDLDAGEIAIREDFFTELNITQEEVEDTIIAPTAYNYTSHMYRQLVKDDQSLAVAIAGMLPCPWLYAEIGKRLVEKGSPAPLYARWIETYVSDEFFDLTERHTTICNELYEKSSEEDQLRMLDAFHKSSMYEYLFWEMASNLEKWPEGVLEKARKE